MKRLLPYYILFLLVLPLSGTAQIPEIQLRSCPSVFDSMQAQVLCTSGTAEEPHRDTGRVHSLHQFIVANPPLLKLGNTTLSDSSRSVTVTYFYRVDTNNKELFCTSFSNQIVYAANATGRKPEFSIRILDSNGVSIDPNCFEAVYSADNPDIWSQYIDNDSLVHLIPTQRQQICFDLRPLHGMVVRICFNTTCYNSCRSFCTASFTLDCFNIIAIFRSDPCTHTVYYTAPVGFHYRWFLASDPSTVLSTDMYLNDRLNQYYSPICCQLSFKNPASPDSCFVETLCYTPTARFAPDGYLFSAKFYWDTLGYITSGTCAARLRLRDSTTILVMDSSGTYSIHDSSIFITQYRIVGLCDTLLYPGSTTIFDLKPGAYMVYRDITTPTCTFTYSNHLTVYNFPCAHYDSLIRTCPDEIDTCSIRYLCYISDGEYSSVPEYDSLGNLIGHTSLHYYYPHDYLFPSDHLYNFITSHHHYPILYPGLDSNTAGQLSTTPPGFSTSFEIGNELLLDATSWYSYNARNFTSQNILFQYHVDTNQHSILMLRYAIVFQVPKSHRRPRFLFHLLDSDGLEINPDLYTIDISNPTPSWNQGIDSTIFWKDWRTFGIGLQALHGRTFSIHISTESVYTTNRPFAPDTTFISYAYFNLQCIEGSIQALHCMDTNFYTAPDGFTYQWFREGHPDSIISTSQQLITLSDSTFYCRLTDISDTSSQILLPTILTPPQYPVARFSLDTLEILDDCSLRLHINNRSHIVTEHSPDSVTTSPCPNFHYWVDDTLTGQPYSPDSNLTDTFTVAPGEHTLTLVAAINGTHCSDTIVYPFLVTDFCHCYDTVFDTIVQNQLPHTWHDILFTDSTFLDSVDKPVNATDTTLFIPGIRPQCDSLIYYHLLLYRNITDSAFLILCPDHVPYAINDSTLISSDTTIIYRSAHGADSIVQYHITILSTSDTTIYDTVIDTQLPRCVFDTCFTNIVDNYIYHTYNEAGCDSTIYYNLYIFWNGDHCDTALSFPNLVTPNGDGINDRFVIGGLIEHNCFKYNELTIYDRYGHCVFHKRNISSETDWWDPAAQHAPSGTYFYYFKAHGINIWTQHRGAIEVLHNK